MLDEQQEEGSADAAASRQGVEEGRRQAAFMSAAHRTGGRALPWASRQQGLVVGAACGLALGSSRLLSVWQPLVLVAKAAEGHYQQMLFALQLTCCTLASTAPGLAKLPSAVEWVMHALGALKASGRGPQVGFGGSQAVFVVRTARGWHWSGLGAAGLGGWDKGH